MSNIAPRVGRLVRQVESNVARAMRRAIPPFPPEFLFGTATADHQCEAYDPRYPDTWDAWEATHAPGGVGVERLQARGRATDFWNRYSEDVQLARALGCNAFRFSISWARVEPEPGRFSEENIEHYRQLAEAVRAASMEPVVTLMHFVWPIHVEQRGGLRAAEFPGWFEAYAHRMREALGDLCRYWITINEPNALLSGYVKPFWTDDYGWPPGLPPGTPREDCMRATADVMRNLFLAHRAARLALRSGSGGSGRLVSVNGYYLGLPTRLFGLPFPMMEWVDRRASFVGGWAERDWALVAGHAAAGEEPRPRRHHPSSHLAGTQATPTLLDRLAEMSRLLPWPLRQSRFFAALSSIAASNWWQLGMRGRLPEFLCPPDCVGQLDFVAFDYYFGTQFFARIALLLDVMERRFDRAPIWPGGLHGALRYFASMFPDLPLFVIENGFAGHSGDAHRARHLRDHLREVQRARADGVNVIGYLAWSLTTNREWGLPSGSRSDFGLYHIDMDGDPALTRYPTPIAAVYESIIRARRA